MKMRRMDLKRQRLAMVAVAVLGMCSAVVLFATNFQLIPISSTDIQKVTWPTSSISWSLNPSNTTVYSAGTHTGGTTLANEAALTSVLSTAFSLWSGAQYQGTNMNTLTFTQGADNSNAAYNGGDCVNSIGFTQNLGGTGIIAQAVVSEVFTNTPGQAAGNYGCTMAPTVRSCPNEVCIVNADIEFNTSYDFYTPSFTPPSGGYPTGFFDLQTVATHEIGHFIGLDHSGLANAIMFPYGDSGTGGVKSALALDDAIGSAVLYTNNAVLPDVGGIKGTVSVGGSPAFGAHVVAIDSTTGNVITDTLTDSSGNYHLRMVSGNYYVLVLPLADSANDNGDTNINNYTGFHSGYPSATNPTNFTGTYY